MLQTAVGREQALGSAPTLCRLENGATASDCAALSRVLVWQFMHAYDTPPASIVLDVDASDIPLHGEQQHTQFHGYYDHYCYLPLYVFCGDHLLASYLHRSRIDGAKNVTALITRLIARIRASCHRFLADQFRLLLSAFAYALMQALKRLALTGTELARVTSHALRVRLLKIGAAVLINTRRIQLLLASHHPLRELFALTAARLAQLQQQRLQR